MRSFGLVFALVAAGCSQHADGARPLMAAPPAAARSSSAVPGAPHPAGSTPAVVPSAAQSTPSAPALCSPGTAPAALSAAAFTRIHAGPVLSAAVGTPPRAGVWSGQSVTLLDGAKALELPAPRLAPGASVELFFGRDNQPRLLGNALDEQGQAIPVYLRFRQGTFRPEPSELGPLAAPHGALYGVLGFADPEVVCRPRELCLVKRTTGWQRAPAHDAPVRLLLRNGTVFALHAERIEQLRDRAWAPVEPAHAFVHPLDVWLAPNGELWVVDESTDGLFRLTRGQWETVSSPITKPRGVFGRSERAVFVVGENGAAEFDGARFRCVSGVNGPLHLALAVGREIWLAGASGVYALRD